MYLSICHSGAAESLSQPRFWVKQRIGARFQENVLYAWRMAYFYLLRNAEGIGIPISTARLNTSAKDVGTPLFCRGGVF